MVNLAVDLRMAIEQKRSEMIHLGMSKGFAHPETIQASQELDILIIKAQGM